MHLCKPGEPPFKRTCLYYSAIKKNKILPFAAAWMDLEGVMLSEIRQRKTNSVQYHLYVESKKIQQTSEYSKREADSQA